VCASVVIKTDRLELKVNFFVGVQEQSIIMLNITGNCIYTKLEVVECRTLWGEPEQSMHASAQHYQCAMRVYDTTCVFVVDCQLLTQL